MTTTIAAASSKPSAGPSAWTCMDCGMENEGGQKICSVCMRAKPLGRQGMPQVFKGMVFHFNGVIPRTLRHASHAIEWRMAERHGATVTSKFDPKEVTGLIYRPGYERSDKVRLCVEQHFNDIPCLPVTWMLECMLQSRQLHPSLFRLQYIPAVALPTTKGAVLPHHQHPFYVQNVEEYALFPSQLPQAMESNAVADARAAAAVKVSHSSGAGAGGGVDGMPPLPSYAIDELQMEPVPIAKAARMALDGKAKAVPPNSALDAEHPSSQKRHLFHHMRVILSESLVDDADFVAALKQRGAAVVDWPADAAPGTPAAASVMQLGTHYCYHNDDKKKDRMIAAAHVCGSGGEGNAMFATREWVEDCMMMGEVVPLLGPYVPTAKLLSTLEKKFSKRAAA